MISVAVSYSIKTTAGISDRIPITMCTESIYTLHQHALGIWIQIIFSGVNGAINTTNIKIL